MILGYYYDTYKNGKEAVPLIRLRNWIDFRHFPHVIKVSVLDMLSQPVLDKFSDFFSDWNNSSFHSVHDTQMSVSMFSNVVLVIQDGGEHALLIAEVVIIKLNHFVPDCLVFTMGFNLPDSIK